MLAQLGLSLPIGTKVRRKRDSKIVAKLENSDENGGLVAFIDGDLLCFLSDDEWELIEEKQEPKQGDELLVQDIGWEDGWNRVEFVCFYKGKVLVTGNGRFVQYDIWRFPPKKLDITLQEIADWKGVEKELINIIN